MSVCFELIMVASFVLCPSERETVLFGAKTNHHIVQFEKQSFMATNVSLLAVKVWQVKNRQKTY